MKRTIALTATALTLALSLAACGDEEQDTQNASADQQSQQRGGGMPAQQPGSGKVAAVDGSTAQVQGASSQTAVSWTGSTTFTQQVSGSLDDLTKGACVLVMGDGSGSDSDAVTASSVRISEAVDGECASGFGGGGGGGERPTDLPSDRPSDLPTDRPDGGSQGERPEGGPQGGGSGGMTSGVITAVTDSGFTIEAARPGSGETSTVTVSVGSDTTYLTSAEASADDVKIGVCLQTRGDADSTGAVAATSIHISQATDGECTTGPGRRGGAQDEEGPQ